MARESARLAALQYRDFRLLWTGELVSTIGSQMQVFAINWHIFTLLEDQTVTLSLFGQQFELASDALGLGTLGLVRVIPIIIFALLGGVLADARDRRTVMLWTRVIAIVIAGMLAILTLTDNITVTAIYVLTAFGAATTALDNPARQSIVPNLVRPEHFSNAISLNTLMFQVATISGPALTGVFIDRFNLGVIYAIDTATFVVAIVSLAMIRHRGKISTRQAMGWEALIEGIRFVYRTRLIFGTMLLDFYATLFASARTMLPLIATDVLGMGASGYGLLATAQPVGAFMAGSVLALRRDIYRQGFTLLVSVGVYGFATALFGISTNIAASYFLFALTGAGDTISTVIRGTIRQLTTPDHLRGRMVSVNMMFFMGGPQLGELEAGLVAAAFGVSFAVLSGGIATVLLTAWVAWHFPSIRRYTSDMQPTVTDGG